ncbi:MAG TPA: cytochrome c3 family protein [Anaerolineales bacterium]|jgi:hypothetical protein
MKKSFHISRKFGFLLIIALLLVLLTGLNVPAASARKALDGTSTPLAPVATPTSAQPAANPHTSGNCLGCHGNDKLVGKLPDGETISLQIVPVVRQGSFHNQDGMSCAFCHDDQKEFPHKGTVSQSCSVCHWQISGIEPVNGQLIFDLPFQDARALSLSINDACRKCHEDKFNEIKDSGHTRILNEGNRYAPVCVDCHNGHDITSVNRLNTSQVCKKCHLAEYSAYKGSVHGSALEKEINPDVPTCSDCHGAHQVTGPRESTFRKDAAADLCGRCHANKDIVGKYSLSTDVLSTYMDDVHGKTDLLGRLDNSSITKATCYDCHGIHNILSPQNPYSRVYPDNLQKTCQECHKDANITFPETWLSHKKPSLSSMPGLYLANVASFGTFALVLGVIVILIILDARRRMLRKIKISTEHKE